MTILSEGWPIFFRPNLELVTMKRIYISSTYKDLIEYRSTVYAALRKVGHDVICMEDYVARDIRTDERCKSDAATCQIYIGIFAWRYGYVPDQDNPTNSSITEIEYLAARRSLDTTVLLFLLADEAPWFPRMMDSFTGENKVGQRISNLREELKQRSPAFFHTPDDLAAQVLAAVYQEEATRKISRIELFNSNQFFLQGSGLPLLIGMISEAKNVDAVEINLGHGESWWSSRLYLMSALASDFTGIQQIIFVDDSKQVMGMYSPDHIRHGLARTYPEYEFAYLKSLNNSISDIYQGWRDPNDIDEQVCCVIDDYLNRLSDLNNGTSEEDIKDWVTASRLTSWMTGKRDADRVILSGQPAKLLQHQIVSCTSPFVALIEENQLIRVIDRVSLASHLAKGIVEEQFR